MEQDGGDAEVTTQAGDVKRSLSSRVGAHRVGSGLEERRRHVSMAVEAGNKEGRGAAAVPGVQGGPEAKQGLGVAVAEVRSDMER